MRKQTIKPMVLTGGQFQFLKLPNPIQSQELDSFTFGQWVNYSATSGTINLLNLSGGDLIYFRINPFNNSLYGYLVDGSNAISELNTGLSADAEMFIVMRYDNTQGQGALHFFANGVQVAELLKPSIGNLTNTSATDQPFYNADAKFHTRFFYSSALSDDQIKGLYNNGLAISASSLPRYKLGVLESCYSLDSENEVIDLGGGGYHGSLVNSPTFDGSPVDTLHTGLQTQNSLLAEDVRLTNGGLSLVDSDFFFSCFFKFPDVAYAVEQYFVIEGAQIGGSKFFVRTKNSGDILQVYWKDSVSGFYLTEFVYLESNKLYHMAVSIDAITGLLTFYLDGQSISSTVVNDTDLVSSGAVMYANHSGFYPSKLIMRNIYFGRKAFGQTGVDWFRNKGVPRDLSIMPSTYADEALSIYEPNLLNGGADISGNGNDCAIVGTPAYTAVEEVQNISDYMLPLPSVPQDGLLMWVDGESGAVNKAEGGATVTDYNTGITNINGVPAFDISGGAYLSAFFAPRPASFTTFVVARLDSEAQNQVVHGAIDATGNDNSAWGAIRYSLDSPKVFSCYHSSPDNVFASKTTHTTQISAGEVFLLVQRYTSGTTEIEIFLNGNQEATAAVGTNNTTNSGNAAPMAVGRFGGFGGSNFNLDGAVGNFGVYDRALTDEEIARVSTYLINKYGV